MNAKRLFSTAAALVLTLSLGVTAGYAEDKSPVSLRAVGGANMGGTWNVGLAGIGKLVNDRYPGSTFNILQGSSSSNPMRLEANSGDITVTQSLNTYSAVTGTAPYKKKMNNLTSIANLRDLTRFHVICSKKIPVDSLDELLAKKIPFKLDRGKPGQMHHEIGKRILAEYGLTYDDIEKWGGNVSGVSNNDLVSLMQDGTIDVAFKVGAGEPSQLQEMVLSADVKWLSISEKVLKAVAEKSGLSVGVLPGSFFGGAVGRDIPCLVDNSVIIMRKGVSEEDAYKVTKSLVEGYKELAIIQPAWNTMDPKTMATDMILPLHPGAEKYYREVGLIK
ncbi:TAXI family TRAP transporter solute-binding subunit [uncultured Mailhella sp.]|uniref:TAXI family TRAP transporter solute-binding subunit n=1 Tax=uncultured Mailhella sp. TaxID=1981031 RepID=UPI0025FB5369|nr:TAXI family TRAP transporter solute-binding subunit [uncultured Mailhella sp.]